MFCQRITVTLLNAVTAAVILSASVGAGQDSDSARKKVAGPFFVSGQDPRPTAKSWMLVENLSDEFNGDTLDPNKWSADPKLEGWGWLGRPPGLFKSESVRIADGNMNVTVSTLPESVTINGQEFLYQGAIVRSKNPGQVGCYFETRMKANQTAMSSTFWLISKGGKGKHRQELDIQECVGLLTEKTAKWAKGWDQIFHSNLIRTERGVPGKVQFQEGIRTPTKNYERFYVYGCWWKSADEVQFFLDGKYAYSLTPDVEWNLPNFIQMAIETYDWNPVPEGGGLITTGTKDQRTTRYDWVRVWELK